ncbi:MAG: hypothetical protein AAB575_03435 [Patescibacteria group bacterium]
MADERIEDSQEYKIAENGKRMKKVKQGDGSWAWVDTVLETAADVLEAVIDFD